MRTTYNNAMKAMVLHNIADIESDPLQLEDIPIPEPAAGEVLGKVHCCAICRTDLHIIEGDLPQRKLPIVPGHQVVGTVEALGPGCTDLQEGDRIGIAWLRHTCQDCDFCDRGQENLCESSAYTGYMADGGYAEYLTVPERYAFPIPDALGDAEAAPLLCAGAVGYRSLMRAELADGEPLGLTGFGASGHLVLQMARHRFPNSPVVVFARDPGQRELARELGAAWSGDTAERAPTPLAAIIDTTPAWKPVVEALANLAPGGRLVVNAIRKEADDQDELLRLRYHEHLWMERELRSVANVTGRDIEQCLRLAAEIGLRPSVETLPLRHANRALVALRKGATVGAKVLRVADPDG